MTQLVMLSPCTVSLWLSVSQLLSSSSDCWPCPTFTQSQQGKMLLRQASSSSCIRGLLIFLCVNSSLLLASGRPQIGFQQTGNRFTNQAQEKQFQNQPNRFAANPMQDLQSGIDDLANGARTTAFLIEEGGPAGIDILSQFGELLGEFRSKRKKNHCDGFPPRKCEQPGIHKN